MHKSAETYMASDIDNVASKRGKSIKLSVQPHSKNSKPVRELRGVEIASYCGEKRASLRVLAFEIQRA